jgi:uncharacterized membrane protein YphA (DoxX/SURF4 family)
MLLESLKGMSSALVARLGTKNALWFLPPMDNRTAMWVRLLAGAMIAIGLLGTIVSLWALSIH